MVVQAPTGSGKTYIFELLYPNLKTQAVFTVPTSSDFALATNVKPFPFSWLSLSTTELEYSALLTRLSREYNRRFP